MSQIRAVSEPYAAGDALDLHPRPWVDCICNRCLNWILEDLRNCIEKCDSDPTVEFVCGGLSRWSIWLPHTYECTMFGLTNPVYLDTFSQNYLTTRQIINWWYPAANLLYPIHITGDGNCLPHAVSMYLWGVQDVSMTLRHLIHHSLLSSWSQRYRQRWQHEKDYFNSLIPDGGLKYTDEEWNREWELLVLAAEGQQRTVNPSTDFLSLPYESLEELHVFVLANVLRRPIIILGESAINSAVDGDAIADNNFVGIYLPLLWPSKLCYKHPVVLAFKSNHFEPLISQVSMHALDRKWQMRNAVPLMTISSEMLRVHFTLPEEENRVHNILQNYLYINEVQTRMPNSSSRISLLVAVLPEPEHTILYHHYYVRERPLEPDEYLRVIELDKHVVYNRCESSSSNQKCRSYKYFLVSKLCDMIVEQKSWNARAGAQRRSRKKERRLFCVKVRSYVHFLAKNTKPRFTILTDEEYEDLLTARCNKQRHSATRHFRNVYITDEGEDDLMIDELSDPGKEYLVTLTTKEDPSQTSTFLVRYPTSAAAAQQTPGRSHGPSALLSLSDEDDEFIHQERYDSISATIANDSLHSGDDAIIDVISQIHKFISSCDSSNDGLYSTNSLTAQGQNTKAMPRSYRDLLQSKTNLFGSENGLILMQHRMLDGNQSSSSSRGNEGLVQYGNEFYLMNLNSSRVSDSLSRGPLTEFPENFTYFAGDGNTVDPRRLTRSAEKTALATDGKCSIIGCERLTQDGGVFCRVCAFQQNITQQTATLMANNSCDLTQIPDLDITSQSCNSISLNQNEDLETPGQLHNSSYPTEKHDLDNASKLHINSDQTQKDDLNTTSQSPDNNDLTQKVDLHTSIQ